MAIGVSDAAGEVIGLPASAWSNHALQVVPRTPEREPGSGELPRILVNEGHFSPRHYILSLHQDIVLNAILTPHQDIVQYVAEKSATAKKSPILKILLHRYNIHSSVQKTT
jgi:hypothetical protein